MDLLVPGRAEIIHFGEVENLKHNPFNKILLEEQRSEGLCFVFSNKAASTTLVVYRSIGKYLLFYLKLIILFKF